ncbi:MAG: hypothetical protein VX974_01890 [Pseudomonadota bacterium]|nr:hypothetical protein [Pseudomonadota bacterium]
MTDATDHSFRARTSSRALPYVARLRAAPSKLRAAWMAFEDSFWGQCVGGLCLMVLFVSSLFILWGIQ